MFKKKKTTSSEVKINLLPKDPFYDSLIGKGTTWALSVGRYIVIFTELVVIISFASRFTLDRRVTDLNKEILTKQSIIESYGDLEQSVRTIQKKLDNYDQLKAKTQTTEVFDVLTQITPLEIQYKDLTITDTSIRFSAHASTTQALSLFLTNIQISPYFQNVSVQQISNKDPQTPGFEFQVQANIAQTQ